MNLNLSLRIGVLIRMTISNVLCRFEASFEIRGVAVLASGYEKAPAGGAGRVGSEPRVDAADVEAVAALGQHSDLVALSEVGEADGAVGGQFPGGGGGGGVGELGEGVEGLLLEALVGSDRAGGPAAGPGAAGHRHEPDHADEGAEEGSQDHHEVRVEAGGGRRRRRRRRRGGKCFWGGASPENSCGCFSFVLFFFFLVWENVECGGGVLLWGNGE
ncbi:hypothetical protein Sjap_017595 [Stephania japonica]|uniref:Uncharacterized protein n=1 Tax=Stephania japonica TaxID=461633 RepID=A0AAP0I6G8_9MAGN